MRRDRLAFGTMLVASAVAGACLVTSRAEFEVENSPSYVVPRSPAYLAYADLVSDPDCAGEPGRTFMSFNVDIFDNDVDQTLYARVIINGVEQQAREIPPASGAVVPRVTGPFCVPVDPYFQTECSLVELIVTSDFDVARPPYGTKLPNDLERAVWLVLASVDAQPYVTASSCLARLQDAGIR